MLLRLNRRQDSGLKARREIIKRVTQFDSFETCWEHAYASSRTAARQKLDELVLRTNLWSLNRAMTRAIVEYEKRSPAVSSLAQQRSAPKELQFIQLLLSSCIDEVSLTLDAFLPAVLRTRLFKAFESNERILDAEVHRAVVSARLCLILQGSLPQRKFEMFTGLRSETARIEVAKLEQLGMLALSKAKPGCLEPRLPGWLAACLLPRLLMPSDSSAR